MTTYIANLGALALTTTEKNTVANSPGFEDAQGMLSAINASIQESIQQLQRLATYVPAGTNLTAINNAITQLQT
ncbi:hypothetical protein [Burkholderia multivorans]|uniref:hypothetical protein n=1 Tax=Burkholderia multivorans TaxID=87883 RepID=UPI0021C1AE85|nr:hypothetical protein [Burkholderia multivorans]MDR9052073.1 hypothetical protein [Burkholderia multivorans]MDR9060145.1 hypothetical protein [Burkholderia multivorans]MDR9062450.1 hypothetical protein [Burkholderia multivorans]MDR9072202.1 hypothetical protein [Burkholderia multivorans]MDR9076527.1 hypothetical protein [Burkholderia multivorans]